MSTKRIAATVKKLRQLARAMGHEAAICEEAAFHDDPDHLYAKCAKTWRGRQRTCLKAIQLLTGDK